MIMIIMIFYSGNYECGRADIAFYTDSDPCITNNIGTLSYSKQMLTIFSYLISYKLYITLFI